MNYKISRRAATLSPSLTLAIDSKAKQMKADGQDVVLNTLKQKVTATSGVNIDDEMAHLLALQNAYSANARVMSSIKQMYDTLIQSM